MSEAAAETVEQPAGQAVEQPSVQPTLSIEERISRAMNPEPVGDDAPEQPSEQPEAREEGADVEEIEVETLSDLAEHFGIEQADLYNLRVPVTMADGSRAEVTLGEWKDGYKSSQEASQEAKRAAQLRESLEAQQREYQQKWESQIQDAAASLSVAEQLLTSEFQGLDWNALRENDPAEWAARRQQYNERLQSLQQQKRELAERWNASKAEQAKTEQQQMAERLETERKALMQAVPEWANEETAQAERSALAEYLASTGFTTDEVNNVVDHRLVVMARKAMMFDKQVKSADAAKKRVIRVGKKPMKPGARITQAEQQQDAMRPQRDQLRKSGRWQDAAPLIAARLARGTEQ